MSVNIRMTIDTRKLDALSGQARQVAGQVVRKAAYDVAGNAQASMERAKHGRVYGAHQASAPGEAPAIDTGTLHNSIQVHMVRPLTAVVAVHAPYGLYLEMGTRRMAARPFLKPAVDKVKPAFREAMRQVLAMGRTR